jgi:hypothetical protein
MVAQRSFVVKLFGSPALPVEAHSSLGSLDGDEYRSNIWTRRGFTH